MPESIGQLIQGIVKSVDRSKKIVHMSSDLDLISKYVTKELKGISIDLLVPGMMINARVQSTLENGVLLSFLTYFTGTVDLFNLNITFPSSKWKNEYAKNIEVNSKLEILSCYADATDGLVTHGWISKIKKHGCFVRFYNGVQGFTPRSELGLGPGIDIQSTYHVEQVVKCRVVNCIPASRRINLSFNITPTRGSVDELIKPGTLVSGVVESISTQTIVVTVHDSSHTKGTISLEHLADHHGLASSLMSVMKPGYHFDKLLDLDVEGNNLVLTANYSLVNSTQQQLPVDISQISCHSVVHARYKERPTRQRRKKQQAKKEAQSQDSTSQPSSQSQSANPSHPTPPSGPTSSSVPQPQSQPPPPPLPEGEPEIWLILLQWGPSRGMQHHFLGIHAAIPRSDHEKKSTTGKMRPWKLEECLGRDLIARLLTRWIDMVHEGDYEACLDLWLHEWRDHGMKSGMTIKQYFGRVCDLYDQIPNSEALLAPFGEAQELAAIRHRIKGQIDADVEVRAYRSSLAQAPADIYLLELGIEMNPHTKEFVNALSLYRGHRIQDQLGNMVPPLIVMIPSAANALPGNALRDH